MPRTSRKQSYYGTYHVILRGINQQIIFEDRYDYLEFINILKYYKETCHFKLYAYCLMNNHVHLLIKHTDVSLDVIMKKIQVKFVRWYNRRYQRTGTLFQDRYKSEPVNDLRYFQTVFRYIHQNPLHAGLEFAPGRYPWSSYHDYVASDCSFIDTDEMISLFSNHVECMKYLHTISDETCLEHYSNIYLPDTEAVKLVRLKTGCNSPSDFQRLDLTKRNSYLKLLSQSGLSVRQLSRLTGISRTSISKAIKQS